LAIFLSVVEQVSLIAFERCASDLGWDCDSISSAPSQKHLHVNAADPECTFGETLHCKVLEIFIQECSEWCGAAAARLSMCQIIAEVPFAFTKNVFFMTPPKQTILPPEVRGTVREH
jgi:hypothetical protein